MKIRIKPPIENATELVNTQTELLLKYGNAYRKTAAYNFRELRIKYLELKQTIFEILNLV